MRLIDADGLEEKMRLIAMEHTFQGVMITKIGACVDFIRMIDKQPTVDTVPIKHGYWDKHYHEEEDFAEWWAKCSECGYTEAVFARGHICSNWNYCPRCGAKMDVKIP